MPNNYNNTNTFDLMLRAMGSGCIAQSFPVWQLSSSQALSSGNIRLVAIYIPKDTLVTSVLFHQTTQGVYTANNYNGIGLYKYSGTSLTLVASTTNDGNIWKASANTYVTTAFSSSYNAAEGYYFLGFLYSTSAGTTAPSILGGSLSNASQSPVDITTGALMTGNRSGGTSLITPITLSGVTTLSATYWGMVI